MSRCPTSKQIAFATWLVSLEADGKKRGILAALRRGLMFDEEYLYQLYSYIPPSFFEGMNRWEERLYLMVAALFAYHPVSYSNEELAERHRNFGESLRFFALTKRPEEAEEDESLPDSLRRRMEGLLTAPRDELFGHLRQMINLLKSEDVKVDWAQLLRDLHDWERPYRPVQWDWSRSFYVGHKTKEEDNHVS